jgi:hypothetical protein
MVEGANLGSDTFKVALSNTAPGSESSNPTSSGNGVLANVTQIAYTNYSDDLTTDRTLESVTSSEASGTLTFDAGDFTITASGGAIADFRYIYLFDDTLAGDPLVCVWDHGSTISLADGDSAAITVNASGIFTVA